MGLSEMRKLLWLLVGLALGVGIQSVTFAQQAPAAIVRVAEASVQSIAPETLVPGTVVSRNDARLAAEVTGRLLEVLDVGTKVAKGDVVAKIEDTAIRLR